MFDLLGAIYTSCSVNSCLMPILGLRLMKLLRHMITTQRGTAPRSLHMLWSVLLQPCKTFCYKKHAILLNLKTLYPVFWSSPKGRVKRNFDLLSKKKKACHFLGALLHFLFCNFIFVFASGHRKCDRG